MQMTTSKSLFSSHYLAQRLPAYPEWQDSAAETTRTQLRALYERIKATLSSANEAQTEEDFIKPALDLLGWKIIVQPKRRTAGTLERPDYAMFTDERSQ